MRDIYIYIYIYYSQSFVLVSILFESFQTRTAAPQVEFNKHRSDRNETSRNLDDIVVRYTSYHTGPTRHTNTNHKINDTTN